MMNGRRLLSVMALTGAAIIVATAYPIAASADSDLDAFVGNGLAGSLLPVIPPADAWPAGTLQQGTFLYDGDCVATLSTDDLPAATTSCQSTGSGSYLNVVCGTAMWSGTMLVQFTPGSTTEDTTMDYTAVVVAGVGVIAVTNVVGGAGVTVMNPDNLGSGGCVTAPVAGFLVMSVLSFVG